MRAILGRSARVPAADTLPVNWFSVSSFGHRRKETRNQAIKFNSNYALPYNNRGIIKRNKGDVAGAIADFDRAITLNPKYANAYRNRGVAKQKKGDNDGAIADFNRAIKLGQQRADVEMAPN